MIFLNNKTAFVVSSFSNCRTLTFKILIFKFRQNLETFENLYKVHDSPGRTYGLYAVQQMIYGRI